MGFNSCIISVIKNEQEYLDEWIQYHLKLGIDHIFLFEDIDSETHKFITDKYENVTLQSIKDVLNVALFNEAVEVKRTKRYSVHLLYIRRALLYIQKKYPKYEWCFVIDNDEFITFEDNNSTLNDILLQFKDYDAFILKWKCFGANNLVHKPDYSNKGVVDTYVKEITGDMKERPSCLCKTCYNLKKYKGEFFESVHYPNNKCNYCNTDFIKSSSVCTYKFIYIRHYITRSWEEYLWKIKQRGFLWGGRRNFDFFFNVNSEMMNLRDKLLSELDKDILVILPYKQSSSQGNEIRLSLNGWKKFCTFNYHFIVIGEYDEMLPKEFSWVEFIYCPSLEKREGQYNPHLDIQNKFKVVMEKYGQKYKGFIYMTDDEYAIKPFNLQDIMQPHYHSLEFIGNKHQPTWFWNHDKWKTRQLLDRENLPHVNYTTHFPYYMEFKKLTEICDKFDLYNESYVFDDLYFNYFKHEDPVLDSKIRLGIWHKDIFKREFQDAILNSDIKFVCNSVEGWSEELEEGLSKIVFSQ